MSDPISGLLAALDLTDTSSTTGVDTFSGPSQWMAHGRVFGGQVLAQSLVAAQRTIDDDRPVHSMHAYFLRPGRLDEPISFVVDRINDGRSFSARRTQAYQDGVPILSAIISFQQESAGLDHQVVMAAGLPDPESLPSLTELFADLGSDGARHWLLERPFDIRHVTSPVFLSVDGEHVAHQAVWVKAIDRLPDDHDVHRAALAYASDYSMLEPILRRHGVSWSTPGLKIASLDHAMWWHRFGRADEWMLFVQESPNAVGGRGLAMGSIYRRDGVLLASVAQEGMIRVP